MGDANDDIPRRRKALVDAMAYHYLMAACLREAEPSHRVTFDQVLDHFSYVAFKINQHAERLAEDEHG